ncbi:MULTISPECIES: DUF5367 family protein [unclassified Synechocystis]|uniref:DUF5367 family protein n=1 Tax=unclassified Synechocystis TaxID=2640012 RepID=UPI00048D6285|nr:MULTISPECIES: DUF5367 family protein [unclassified Synechocystis]AIE73571.1 hypothetical protein D082_10430 [Synechocystis sp. PCC 6714]MCT0252287.1 DUF5367 domain-containing protein [Synechocystis sp. CS-94]
MNRKDRLSFVLVGFGIWAAATVAYRQVGSVFFERSIMEYWFNVASTGGLYTLVFVGLMRWRRIKTKEWLQGAICIALPGMLGEIPILAGFSDLMSNMHPETAGRYAAFLFSGYSILLGFAWFMATKDVQSPAKNH